MSKLADRVVVKGPIDGNIYAIIGAVSKAMRRAGQDPAEYQKRVQAAGSYDEALRISMEYADFDL